MVNRLTHSIQTGKGNDAFLRLEGGSSGGMVVSYAGGVSTSVDTGVKEN